MELEFIDEEGSRDRVSSVYLKGVYLFTIRYEKDEDKYWIDTFQGFIRFRYVGFNPDNDLDFVETHKYSKTLDGAKANCKKIMYSFINWLTEK